MSHPIAHRPLRFVFYRPHTEVWFKNTLRQLLKGYLYPHKYEALFDWLLESGVEVAVSTALCQRKGLKGFVSFLLDPFALIYWVIGNKIGLSRVSFVFSKAGLRKQDVLFFMHYGNFTFEDSAGAKRGEIRAQALSDVDILKIGHFTHYAYQPVIGANNLSKLGVNVLMAENDLQTNSEFYRRYFGNLNAEFWCLPYVAAERFKSQTTFRERSCKLVATGSITFKMIDPDFINFFNSDELQPLRRQIYEHADDHTAEIDCMISDLNASRVVGKANVDPFWRKAFRRIVPHPQHSYFKKNIVDEYNSHMMFTVPEELGDLPAIGFVEGMACGCAFFGLDSPMYRNLGFVPGVHYVAHNGTLEDLVEKIRFYQQPSQLTQLEQIAERGCKLVSEKFRAEVVYQEFLDRLTVRVFGCETFGANR